MTDDSSPSPTDDGARTRRAVLRAAGAGVGAALLGTTATAADGTSDCVETTFYTPAYEGPDGQYCIQQPITTIEPGVQGQIYDRCGNYVRFLPNDPDGGHGWIEDEAVGPCG